MALKPSQQIFITEFVRSRNKIEAVRIAYPKIKSNKVAVTNANRLLKNAEISKEISTLTKQVNHISTELAVQELKDEIKLTVLTVAKKRELLHNIATGQAKEIVQFPDRRRTIEGGKETIQTIILDAEKKPGHYQVMRAIEIDNRMAGDNAPTPGGDGNPQPSQEIKHLHIHLSPDDIRQMSQQLEDMV